MSDPSRNVPRRRGPIARAAIGAWDALNFTRRLVFNLLFLLVLVLLVVAIFSADRSKPLLDRTTLVIAPEGALVEQFSVDPVSRALGRMSGQAMEEVRLRDLLRVIEEAASDDRIERVLLRTDRMAFSGYASLRELADAIGGLREAGKEVIAFGEYFGQAQYLVAAQADEVYMDPYGGLVLEGIGRYRQYYREGLQDKLGVDVHLFKVGEFKSAAEPYVLDQASPESKEADLYWMNDIWQRFVADVATARGLDAGALSAAVEGLPAGVQAAGGDLARLAVDQKLVDGLKTLEEVQQLLAERGEADEDSDSGVREVAYDDYLNQLTSPLPGADARPKVAVVVAEGQIMGGEQNPGRVGGESTSALLRQAREDDKVKAVVLRVDSPGGEVFASEQIRREIEALKAAGKPVVASMGDLAASGGYWISMNADTIYADPSTITGSIGVFGLLPNFTRTLDRLGIHTDGVGTTRLAGAFDPTRPMEPEVGRLVQASVEKIYADFVGKVADGRDSTPAAIDEIARGRVWSGAQAHDRGLVDELGGLGDALAEAARRAELEEGDYRVRYVEKAPSAFAQFLEGMSSSRVGAMLLGDGALTRSLMADAVPELERHLQVFENALENPRGAPIGTVAYCFCTIR